MEWSLTGVALLSVVSLGALALFPFTLAPQPLEDGRQGTFHEEGGPSEHEQAGPASNNPPEASHPGPSDIRTRQIHDKEGPTIHQLDIPLQRDSPLQVLHGVSVLFLLAAGWMLHRRYRRARGSEEKKTPSSSRGGHVPRDLPKRERAVLEAYARARNLLKARGSTPAPGQTPTGYARTLEGAHASALELLTEIYLAVRHGRKDATAEHVRSAQESIAQLQEALSDGRAAR